MATKVTHTLTVTETSSTAPSKLGFSIEVLKTKNGILRLLETIMGVILLVLLITTYSEEFEAGTTADPWVSEAVFFMCVLSSLHVTLLLLIAYLASPMAAQTLPKLLFELMHNIGAALFYLSTSLAIFIAVEGDEHAASISWKLTCMIVLGICTAILYGINTYFSYIFFKST